MSAECKETFELYNPSRCAIVPNPHILNEEAIECTKKCNSNWKSACYYECIFEVAGVFVDGKYQPEFWMKAVETFFVKFNFTDTMKETWSPVVKKAYETCEQLSNNFILGHYF